MKRKIWAPARNRTLVVHSSSPELSHYYWPRYLDHGCHDADSERTYLSFQDYSGYLLPVTVAARSKAWTVFSRSDAGIVGLIPTQDAYIWCMRMRLFCVYVVLCLGRGLAHSPKDPTGYAKWLWNWIRAPEWARRAINLLYLCRGCVCVCGGGDVAKATVLFTHLSRNKRTHFRAVCKQ
jgi:hypothetical protein